MTRLAGERLRRLFRTAVAPKKITAMLLQRKPMPNAMLLVGKREVKVQLKAIFQPKGGGDHLLPFMVGGYFDS